MDFCPHLLAGLDALLQGPSCTAVGGSSNFCFRTVCGFWSHMVSRRAVVLILASVSLKSVGWGWGRSHSIFWALLWCFCLPPQLQKFIFSVIFVCFVEDLEQNAVCLAATCSFISFSHFHGVKASHPSGCLRSLLDWPYCRHQITFLSVPPQIPLDLAMFFSGHWSQWAHHSYLLAISPCGSLCLDALHCLY